MDETAFATAQTAEKSTWLKQGVRRELSIFQMKKDPYLYSLGLGASLKFFFSEDTQKI